MEKVPPISTFVKDKTIKNGSPTNGGNDGKVNEGSIGNTKIN